MSDCEQINLNQSCEESIVQDRDDLSGMALNMLGKIDGREIFIIWCVFIFIHSEMYIDHILKRFTGAVDSDNNSTMRGTIYSSFFMMIVVVLCIIIF